MDAIELVRDRNYAKRAEYTDESQPCVYCGRPIKNTALDDHKFLVLSEDGGNVVDPQTEPNMGCFPIGNDCLAKHPEYQPYVVPGE